MMAQDFGRWNLSSSPGLSSPPSPHSPTYANTASNSRNTPILPSQHADVDVKGGGEKSTESALAKNTPPVKKPRKKREPKIKNDHSKSSTATATDGKDAAVKVRKPRGPSGTSSSTVGRRKKVIESNEIKLAPAQLPSRPTKITETTRSSLPSSDVIGLANSPSHENGKNEAIAKSTELVQPVSSRISIPRSSSGQNYDPIRSATIEPRTRSPPISYTMPVRSSTPPPPPPKYASASTSPSITSLIEHQSSNQNNSFPQPPKRISDIHAPSSPTAKKPRLSPPAIIYVQPLQSSSVAVDHYSANSQVYSHNAVTAVDIEIDPPHEASSKPSTLLKRSTTSTNSSTSHSPKPSRQKETPAVLSSGNGLLSNAMFGGAFETTSTEKIAPTVVLDVPLEGGINKYVNFARMAEEQYGFNALYPRLAAQRDRLARVAAVGAALENAHKIAGNSGSGMSGDEMSVDLSENDGGGEDSNMEMGGTGLNDADMTSRGRSGGEGSEGGIAKKVPKKRMMKEDQYDKDDPFVDDTELAWEEQAAASKDGFFVYSGPLVPEGEKPVIERYAILCHMGSELD